MKRLLLLPAVLVALGSTTAVAGPHSGHEHHHRASSQAAAVEEAPTRTIVVVASDFEFQPSQLELEAGVPTRIELQNTGDVDHALVVQSADKKQDVIHLHAKPGESVSGVYRFSVAGKHRIVCTVEHHEEYGMVGDLAVTAGQAAAGP